MIQLNAYAIKKKKNKGYFRILWIRPLEADPDRSDAFEVFIKTILSVYEHQFWLLLENPYAIQKGLYLIPANRSG